ncbi:MAG: hypothetical protein WCT12_03240 [Verrucomicrobiota bacterium]
MLKKFLPVLFLPLLLAGCATHVTNLTPLQQVRNPNNLYSVDVALASNQQTLRWDSVRAQILVGAEVYPMRGTLLMTNRWEGLVPVPPGAKSVTYRYRFDYDYNAIGKPKAGSRLSKEYTLRVQEK